MAITENQLSAQINSGKLKNIYFLYGDENYLISYYANEIAKKVLEGSEFDDFNLHKFDGSTDGIGDIIDAAEALPLMAERKCLLIRDYDAVGSDDKLILEFLKDVPEHSVIVFWHDLMEIDFKKRAKWNKFIKAVDKAGESVKFPRKTREEIAKLLISGAKRRDCILTKQNAFLMHERCGDSLYLLLGELEKFCAIADGGEITREIIEKAGIQNLEASVFELSKAILAGNEVKTHDVLNRLFWAREEPIAILAVLSGAYADLYRAKVATNSGVYAPNIAKYFPKAYRGKEFRLKNAARDCAKLSIETVTESLEILAHTDEVLKSVNVDKNIMLERTVAELIYISKNQKERRA